MSKENNKENFSEVSGSGDSGVSLYKWVKENPDRAIKKLSQLEKEGVMMLDVDSKKYKYYERLKKAIDSTGYNS